MAYNPGTQYRGDAYLFTGISRAGDAVGEGIQRRKQERQEFDALAKYAEAAGYGSKDDTTPMSLSELKGFVRGMEAKTMQAERKTDNDRQNKLVGAQVKNFEDDNTRAAAAATAEQDRRKRTKDLYGTLARQAEQVGPNPDGSTQGDMTWEAIVNAAVESGFDGSPLELKQLADGIRMGRQKETAPAQFEEDPETGERFARYGNTLLPSGRNPKKQEPKLVPLLGADGEVMGYAMPSGKGFQFVKGPPGPTFEGQLDPDVAGSPKFKGMPMREFEKRFKTKVGNTNAPAGGLSFDDFTKWRGQ